MFRKRFERATKPSNIGSPRSKVRKLIGRSTDSRVKRILLFHQVLVKQLREKYRKSENKRLINKVFVGNITRKYKLNTEVKRVVGIAGVRSRKRKGSKTMHMKKIVQNFVERDDV